MQNKAHISPLYRKWHRRVEGQITDCIKAHPEWFNIKDTNHEYFMVNSLAKRIVGEIVADDQLANNPGVADVKLVTSGNSVSVCNMDQETDGVNGICSARQIFQQQEQS